MWDFLNVFKFDIILLETSKNYDQMKSIILQNKKFKYLEIDNLFINNNYFK
jgi:hypothetical protein